MLAHNTCWICTTKSENRPITLFLLLLACYSHPGIDVKLMSIHHCLSPKLPDVVADIKINAVLLPFTANQLEAQNIQNDRGQFIDQARKITIIFSAKIYIWWFHDIVQNYQYVCYHVEQWKSGRKCAILFQQIGNISSEKRNWNTFVRNIFLRNWRMIYNRWW